METMTGNVSFPVTRHIGKAIALEGVVDADVPLYQPRRIKRFTARWAGRTNSKQGRQPLQGAMNNLAHIKALETELLQYRYMIEKMVRQRTARLDRCVALLKACNSRLCDDFGKMREKYLDLLNKVQDNGLGSDATNSISLEAVEPSLAGRPMSSNQAAGCLLRPLVETLSCHPKSQNLLANWLLPQGVAGDEHEFNVHPVAKWLASPQASEEVHEFHVNEAVMSGSA